MEELEITCAIVGEGCSFNVKVKDGDKVTKLQTVIKEENEDITCPARKLQLFLAKKDGEWLDGAGAAAVMLDEDGTLRGFGHRMDPTLSLKNAKCFGEDFQPGEGQVHVLVVVPKVESKRPGDAELDKIMKRLKTIEQKVDSTRTSPVKTLTDFTDLSVTEAEFQLDSLSTKQASDSPIVMTPDLHKFWKGFGEFPPYYFVRMEKVVFWGLIKKLLTIGKDRVVVVGSPGVGKSCFLMLIAFYLACIEKKKVLVIRRLKEIELANAVVYFDGEGKYARLTNVRSGDLYAIRSQAKGATVLVDGFRQKELKVSNQLLPFHFLATSCQFDAKQDDTSHVVVLPAWRNADLLQYAKLTDWVIETGLAVYKDRLKDSTWPKLVGEQYFYSGGSLREFCRTRHQLKARVVTDCATVRDTQAFQLVYSYGGGKSKSQVDRIRRHYIDDCRKEEHYQLGAHWKLSVDSGYALSKLGRTVGMDKQLEVYTYAKSIGAGFHGVAYELLLHNAIQGAFAKRKPVVLKMREGSKYEKIEIRVPHIICRGEAEKSCYDFLTTLGNDTYWYPDYPFFPFINAVTTCEAFPSGSKDSETIEAYIQVTIASEKSSRKRDYAC